MVVADRTAEIRVSMWEGAAINTDHLGDNDHFDKNITSQNFADLVTVSSTLSLVDNNVMMGPYCSTLSLVDNNVMMGPYCVNFHFKNSLYFQLIQQ